MAFLNHSQRARHSTGLTAGPVECMNGLRSARCCSAPCVGVTSHPPPRRLGSIAEIATHYKVKFLTPVRLQNRCKVRVLPILCVAGCGQPAIQDVKEPCARDQWMLLQGVLLDQYGCLHDGRQPYPGAIQAVAALAEAGMHIVLLSNSSRSVGSLHFAVKCA